MAAELIYGFHAVSAAIETGKVTRLYYDTTRHDQRLQSLLLVLTQDQQVEIIKTDQKHLMSLVGGQRHQGVVAEIIKEQSLNEQDLYALLEKITAPFLLILDGVTDPHNLGACLRSAEAFGVNAVVVPADRACGLTAVARKVASGSAERIPFVQVVNLSRCLESLRQRGIWVTGLAGEATQDLYQMDFKGAIAIVMGSEGQGLRRLTKENCDFLVNIPMCGAIESLNVSVATGITLSEAARQRR